jgi:hypothetical protein
MKNFVLVIPSFIVAALLLVNCSDSASHKVTDSDTDNDSSAVVSTVPPETWQEHWFEHDQLLNRAFYDEEVAIYYDDDVTASLSWPHRYFSDVWEYTEEVYGPIGDDQRLFVIFHRDKYSGGHPSTHFDNSHDNRNVADVGPGPWADSTGNNLDLPTHEIAHIVEGAAKGVKGSPAFDIWKDSKWAEIYNYDVYVSLAMEKEAERWFNLLMNNSDDFPRRNTYWFRDWFYPIWKNHGNSEVLSNFFELLSEHFPKDGRNYAGSMNWREFVHFWSGAADTNLKDRATEAFGWPDEWQNQFENAQSEFDEVTY